MKLGVLPIAWRSWARRLADAVYPRVCAVCETFFESDGGVVLCERCSGALSALAAEPFCHRCAKPVATEGAACPWCLQKGLYPYQRVLRLGEYEDPLRQLILDLKFKRKWTIGEVLADVLAELPRTQELVKSDEVIVAVPLHFRREYRRGFNQAATVAERLASRFKSKCVRPAKRIRNTEAQTQLTSVKARQDNVRGAFRLTKGKLIEGKRVLVVDDVLTTGATIQSFARCLMDAKPASLEALVLAVADPKRRDFEAI